MFTENDPYKRYRQTKVETANPLELIIMLYDGALRFINQAKIAIADRDYMAANNSLKRAQDIINELNYNLNMEAGGEIAANLRHLYEFIINRLLTANVKKDVKILNEAVEVINTLKSSWIELKESQKPQKQAVNGE